MEVLTIQNNLQGQISRSFVRSGIAGNYDIIFEMRRVIRNSVNYDIALRDLTAHLLMNSNLDSYATPERQLERIFKFIASNVEYIQDPAGLIESLKEGRVTLADGYGDCDDLTVLACTMLGDIGFEDVRIAMSRFLETDQTFTHVYTVVYVNGQRFVLDTSLPHAKFNYEMPAYEVKEIPVFETVEGMDTGATAIWMNLKSNVKHIGNSIVKGLPLLGSHLPLGFAGYQAFSTGAQILNYSAEKNLSVNSTVSKINQDLDSIIVELLAERMPYELAKGGAAQIAAQYSAIEKSDIDSNTLRSMKKSIQNRLEFIKNFPEYAKAHDIDLVDLNGHAMLLVGIAGAGFGVWIAYRLWKEHREAN